MTECYRCGNDCEEVVRFAGLRFCSDLCCSAHREDENSGRGDAILNAEEEGDYSDYYDDSMDGDHQSGLASAGFGTDEDYGYYGGEDSWLDGSYEE